jgi:hypothetical protein
MDTDRVDLVLQYILASAGERHGGEREVTVTQMVKYAYLADAAHAARHDGDTFTHAPWTFSQYGPHAPEVEARVAPVARRIGASTRGAYLLLEDDDLGHRRAAELSLPAPVTVALQRAIRAFSHDNHGLLVHVYATEPMRRCLPGEPVDFTPVAAPEPPTPVAPPPPLSARARAALTARRAMVRTPAVPPTAYAPRYDDCFVAGQRALDAPERALVACGGTLTVEPSAWSAPARRERDVP